MNTQAEKLSSHIRFEVCLPLTLAIAAIGSPLAQPHFVLEPVFFTMEIGEQPLMRFDVPEVCVTSLAVCAPNGVCWKGACYCLTCNEPQFDDRCHFVFRHHLSLIAREAGIPLREQIRSVCSDSSLLSFPPVLRKCPTSSFHARLFWMLQNTLLQFPFHFDS